uniref:DUF1840 domain-containing protein n=1 Tax=uncultured Thiotrichaceae bacterium TaxID=298394 RepID=A0A6S6RTE3_9GAMM|nr:MAG: Unknown protein [uncultured Thiotrichaceae bacterium]
MLVKFTSKSASSVSMFEKDAGQLLKLMGCSGTIPSAIREEDVAEKLATLERALQVDDVDAENEAAASDDDEPAVPMNRRAYPLIELLNTAISTKKNVNWDYDRGIF